MTSEAGFHWRSARVLVTLSFPFTDLSAIKRRPALVLSVHGSLEVRGATSRGIHIISISVNLI